VRREDQEVTMKAMVDKDKCTGCGLCADICPNVFELVDDLAEVIVDVVPPESEESCHEALINCPVEAISVER
jgi:ferredoxin